MQSFTTTYLVLQIVQDKCIFWFIKQKKKQKKEKREVRHKESLNQHNSLLLGDCHSAFITNFSLCSFFHLNKKCY